MGGILEQTSKGVIWSSVERFSTQFVQLFVGLILARLLLPSDFGVIGIVSIFISLSQTFVDSGFSNALIRTKNQTNKDYCTAFYFNIVVGLGCYFVLFILAPWISLFFRLPILCDILRVVSINVFFNSLIVVQVVKLTVAIDFKTQAKSSVFSSLISGLIGIVLAYCGKGIWALAFQSVSATFIKVVLLWFYTRWVPQIVFSKEAFHRLFSYGSKILAAGLLNEIYNHLNTIAIGRFYSAKDLGFYTRGQQFASLLSQNITSVIQRVTFPILANIQEETERLIYIYRQYIRITSMGMFFLLSLLAALGRPIVLFLLTEKWSGAIIYLQLFSFSLMFDHICSINLNLLQVKGRSDLILRLEIVKKSIGFLLLVVSIPLGVLAICISKLLYTQIAIFINTYYTGKLFCVGYLQQWKDFSIYLFFSVISVLPTFFLSSKGFNHLLTIVLGTLISLTIYVMLLLLSKDLIFKFYIVEYFKKKYRINS